MKTQAIYLGVDPKNIIIQDRSLSTIEDAKFSLEILKAKKIKSLILVTSPFHMRRAAEVVRKQFGKEIKVIAYPVQKSSFNPNQWWKRHEDTQTVIVELLSTIFYKIKRII
jgi:uncharacterized SAM-binding protein YcdF (DUF218 family)